MKRKSIERRRIVIALVGTLLVLIAVSWIRARSGADKTRSALKLDARSVQSAPTLLIDSITATESFSRPEEAISGSVQPYHVAAVSAEVERRILSRPVRQGEFVAGGTMIALLDTDAPHAVLDQATGAWAQATAARRQAESDYARSTVETDAARQQARAQLAQATAARRQAESDYARASIETDAGRDQARAGLAQASSAERKAQSALAQAKTDERLARIKAERYTRLVRQGASAQQTLDRAQATLDGAVERRVTAEQTVSLAREGRRISMRRTRRSIRRGRGFRSPIPVRCAWPRCAIRSKGSRPRRIWPPPPFGSLGRVGTAWPHCVVRSKPFMPRKRAHKPASGPHASPSTKAALRRPSRDGSSPRSRTPGRRHRQARRPFAWAKSTASKRRSPFPKRPGRAFDRDRFFPFKPTRYPAEASPGAS